MQSNTCICAYRLARALRVTVIAALPLAGCSLERFGGGDDPPPAAPASTSSSVSALAPTVMPRGGPPIEMTGRWVLASTGSSSCGMVFNSTAGAREGTVAPEGGCPGKLFTSRKWGFEQNSLVIRNHNGEPLAQLVSAEPGRLEGRSTAGESISLTR